MEQDNQKQLEFYQRLPETSIDIEKEGSSTKNNESNLMQEADIILNNNTPRSQGKLKYQKSGVIEKNPKLANQLQQIQSVATSQEDDKVSGEHIDSSKQQLINLGFNPAKIPIKKEKNLRIKKRIRAGDNTDSKNNQFHNTNVDLKNKSVSPHGRQQDGAYKVNKQLQSLMSPQQSNDDEFRLPPIQVKNTLQTMTSPKHETNNNANTRMSIQSVIGCDMEFPKSYSKVHTVAQKGPDEQGDIFEKSEQSNCEVLNTLVSPKRDIKKNPKVQSQMLQILQKEMYRKAIESHQKCMARDIVNKTPQVLKNKNFAKYQSLYQNFTNKKEVQTDGNIIIDIIINHTSDRVLCLLKESDSTYIVDQYNVETYERLNHLEIRGDFIKANKIEQNESGNLFAVAYIDDGFWRLVVFNFNEVIVDFDVNSSFNLDNYTVPISGFSQPFATCCFVQNNMIFFNFFYRPTKSHHHFIFNPFKKIIVKKIQKYQIKNCTNKNYPQKCYYDPDKQLIYILYRQGILCTIEANHPEEYNFEKISNLAFGDTIMFKHKIFITESCQQILFFKRDFVQNEEKWMWVNYFSIQSNGFISGDQKINQFQVIEEANIKFYEIDETTGIPSLQNVMVNFMQANMVNFGIKGQFCIQYKRSHENFLIFKIMLEHDFKTIVNHSNFEGAHGISVDLTDFFIVAKEGTLYTYNDLSFELINKIELNLEQSTTREPLEIISMTISKDCGFIAIIVGKQLIKDEELITKMVIMKRDLVYNCNDPTKFQFQVFKEINMVDFELTNVCKKLHFDNKDSHKLIFVTEDQITTFNFVTEVTETLYDFANDFTEQPEFFVFNDNQDVCIIASTIDTLMINLNNYDEVDLDLIYALQDIKKLIFDCGYFYILANKKEGMIGNFLLKLSEQKSSQIMAKDQKDVVESFLLNSFSKLNIGDCDMCIRNGENKKNNYKQLLISYKSIYINVYSVFVLDLQTGILIFRHESSCLWESNIASFFVKRSKDYISLSAEGMSIMSLHGTQMKKHVMDDHHKRHLVHSLPSCNYLKLEKQNSIRFECCNNRRILSVQNQYKCGFGYTKFEDIYKLDICQLQLRELLILQSIFHSDETLIMFNLIKSQGNYGIFFRSYLELDGQNMVSILAFDNNTIQQLLQPENSAYFRADYPLFYNNKHLAEICEPKKRPRKSYIIQNAIDTALESNKIRAVGLILDHVVTYQNNYVSSYLFNYNLSTLMERGIKVDRLLDSDVFSYKFQYPEWPAAHTDVRKTVKPYNGSIFDIRHSYSEVFEDLGDPINSESTCGSDRFYKITYSLNLLPRIEQTCADSGISFTKLCEDRTCQDLQIFSSQSLQEIIYFKWGTHAFALHYFGALMHAIYIFIISVYIYNTYLTGIYGECTKAYLPALMALGIVYPFLYDAYQLYQQGSEYFQDPWNYSDLLFHWSSILNVVFQVTYEPWHPTSTITMSLVIALALVKTMFFLRIFDNLAYLVTLIREVIYDLKVFMLLYVIMVYMFSLVLGVLGWQNYTRDPEQWAAMQETMKYPGVEYYHIGRFLGNILTIARMSIGDNDFAASHYMSDHICNLLVWLTWAVLLFIMVIIFLNFIIAEACASYEKVRKNLDSFLQYQKLTLINESEDMMWPGLRTKERFPGYLIVRQKED